MKKSRPKIPARIADEVVFRSDMLCAVCQSTGHHIHHLDGHPSNNGIENLILLCFTHHNEATAKGKLSRKLSGGVLLRYRESHYRRVELKRRSRSFLVTQKFSGPPAKDTIFQLAMDAVACIEIEKTKIRLAGHDWPTIEKHIYELNSFPSEIGFRARSAILYALDSVSGRTRHHMPLSVAQAVRRITTDILPSRDVDFKKQPPVTGQVRELLHIGVTIGFNIVYDAIKYLRNVKTTDEGAQILWQVLCYAHRNGIADVEKFALSEIDSALQTADEVGSKHSSKLLNIYRAQGLSGNFRFPDYPADLIAKLI